MVRRIILLPVHEMGLESHKIFKDLHALFFKDSYYVCVCVCVCVYTYMDDNARILTILTIKILILLYN